MRNNYWVIYTELILFLYTFPLLLQSLIIALLVNCFDIKWVKRKLAWVIASYSTFIFLNNYWDVNPHLKASYFCNHKPFVNVESHKDVLYFVFFSL